MYWPGNEITDFLNRSFVYYYLFSELVGCAMPTLKIHCKNEGKNEVNCSVGVVRFHWNERCLSSV